MTQETPKIRDTKELLGEAKRLFKDFFHRGYMTLQTAGDRWKQYHQVVATAKDALWEPFFPVGQLPARLPESTPMVTIKRSEVAQLHAGTRLPLAEANRKFQALDGTGKIEIQIDYYMDSGPDRYRTELSVGEGAGSIQEQIAARIAATHQSDVSSFFASISVPNQDSLQAHISPALSQSFEDISTRLVGYLAEHCAISSLEQQLEAQAKVMPQATQQTFRETARESIDTLRRSASGHLLAAPTAERTGPGKKAAPPSQQGSARASVKITLRAIRDEGNSAKPKPPRPKER